MKLRIVFFIILTTLFTACSAPVEYTRVNLLRMTNNSQTVIFTTLITQSNRHESFGGVGPNGSKGIGFSPTKLENEISIKWGEDNIEENRLVKFQIEEIHSLTEPISELNFVYLGNGLWEMRVFGNNKQTLLLLTSKEV